MAIAMVCFLLQPRIDGQSPSKKRLSDEDQTPPPNGNYIWPFPELTLVNNYLHRIDL